MKSKSKRVLGAAVAGLALSFLMNGANADTVTIQLQEAGVNGGAITTVATGTGLANVTGLALWNVYVRFRYGSRIWEYGGWFQRFV